MAKYVVYEVGKLSGLKLGVTSFDNVEDAEEYSNTWNKYDHPLVGKTIVEKEPYRESLWYTIVDAIWAWFKNPMR